MKRALFLAAILFAAVPATQKVVRAQGGIEQEILGNQRQLEELKKQADAKRRKVKEFREQERGILDRLSQAEQAIAATADVIEKMEARETELVSEIQQNEGRLSTAEKALDERREALRNRLRAAYKYGRGRSLEVLLSAESFAGILQRASFLNRLLHQDEVLVHRVEEQQVEVNSRLRDLREKQAEVDRLQQEKEAEREEFEALKTRRSRDLWKVRDQRSENEQSVRELEQAANRLQDVLGDLERQRQDAIKRRNPVHEELDRLDFSKNRGRLPWPTDGRVVMEFGRHENPKYHTVTISNGIDIAAPVGTPVHSVADGVVDLVQWLPGYGQTVILNHGRGFYTVYGHLSTVNVSEGERVEPGTAIASVGETGSLKGPCLHFEVREGGDAEDPRSWLR